MFFLDFLMVDFNKISTLHCSLHKFREMSITMDTLELRFSKKVRNIVIYRWRKM